MKPWHWPLIWVDGEHLHQFRGLSSWFSKMNTIMFSAVRMILSSDSAGFWFCWIYQHDPSRRNHVKKGNRLFILSGSSFDFGFGLSWMLSLWLEILLYKISKIELCSHHHSMLFAYFSFNGETSSFNIRRSFERFTEFLFKTKTNLHYYFLFFISYILTK